MGDKSPPDLLSKPVVGLVAPRRRRPRAPEGRWHKGCLTCLCLCSDKQTDAASGLISSMRTGSTVSHSRHQGNVSTKGRGTLNYTLKQCVPGF